MGLVHERGSPHGHGGGIQAHCLGLPEISRSYFEPSNKRVHAEFGPRLVRLAEQAERNNQYRLAGYRAKAWESLSLAESVNDPERRVDLLLFGRMWLSLTEPIQDDLRAAYELPPRLAA